MWHDWFFYESRALNFAYVALINNEKNLNEKHFLKSVFFLHVEMLAWECLQKLIYNSLGHKRN